MNRLNGMMSMGCVFVMSMMVLAGCGDSGVLTSESPQLLDINDSDITKAEIGKADSSVEAVFLDFDFSGELLTTSSFNHPKTIEKQLLYTIGQLNGERSVGRLDKLRLRDIKTEQTSDGLLMTYNATLQVAWGKRNAVPATYEFLLPRDVSSSGLEAFTESYSHSCVDFGAHDVDSGSMWYYYRPAARACKLADGDVFKIKADVVISPVNTTGKYPEYHKVWEDGVLNVVAVFGKYEDGATSSADAGVRSYGKFSQEITSLLKQYNVTSVPEALPSNPGVEVPEIVYEATIDANHKVIVHTILVDNVRTAGRDFDQWYGSRSRDADLIIYNGHAGLGSNIRALARKGDWVTGQYTMVFMNGCDTYAYVDSALFDAHKSVNDDDETGTKYVDLITNAMPSFFVSMPKATTALIRGLAAFDNPLSYEKIFTNIDAQQIVLVSGEEDNVFVPGMGEAPSEVDEPWAGLELDGSLSRDEETVFSTPTLPPGSYTFLMSGDNDADLYVRVGLEPTTEHFDCRPFKSGSDETCIVELSSPAMIHGMVRGWAASSDYSLLASPE